MLFPAFYMDEDNYEDYRNLLTEIQTETNKERIFVGSGEDANHAWEQSNGKA